MILRPDRLYSYCGIIEAIPMTVNIAAVGKGVVDDIRWCARHTQHGHRHDHYRHRHKLRYCSSPVVKPRWLSARPQFLRFVLCPQCLVSGTGCYVICTRSFLLENA